MVLKCFMTNFTKQKRGHVFDVNTREMSVSYVISTVVPDVRIPKREERRPPRQCNWQKGEVYY